MIPQFSIDSWSTPHLVSAKHNIRRPLGNKLSSTFTDKRSKTLLLEQLITSSPHCRTKTSSTLLDILGNQESSQLPSEKLSQLHKFLGQIATNQATRKPHFTTNTMTNNYYPLAHVRQLYHTSNSKAIWEFKGQHCIANSIKFQPIYEETPWFHRCKTYMSSNSKYKREYEYHLYGVKNITIYLQAVWLFQPRHIWYRLWRDSLQLRYPLLQPNKP